MHRIISTALICLCITFLSGISQPVFASAWVSSHFIARNIEYLQDNSPVITAYPIMNYLPGPGTHTFDSFTQLVMTQGSHKLMLNIIHEQTGKIYATSTFNVNATYDGYTHSQIAQWDYASKEPGWYRFEISSSEGSKAFQVISTFFFYQYTGDEDANKKRGVD